MSSIAPFDLPGTFFRGNLHTHSTLSDGRLPVSEVVDAYQRKGYDFLMMSEHFVDLFDFPIADTRAFRSNSFTTILGTELHAPENSCGELWHILAAGLPLDFAPCGDTETMEELADRAAQMGAFISIAHPAWSQLNLADGKAIECAHSVEIYNHGCAVEQDRGDGWYLLEEMLRDGHRLTANATDDAHFHCDDAFGGWVNVKSESLDPDALLEALKEGAFYSSQGPQFHDIAISGNEISISCTPVDAIAVQGGTSRSVTRTGKAITTACLDISKLSVIWTGQSAEPARRRADLEWIRVVIIDAAGKKAWSNPIWLN